MSRRDYEAPDLEAAVARQIAALVRRATEGDLEALECLAHLSATVHDAMGTAARSLHARRFDGPGGQGYSWTEIADALGVTRQAAYQRFAHQAAS